MLALIFTLLPMVFCWLVIGVSLPRLDRLTRAGLALFLPIVGLSWLTLLLSFLLPPLPSIILSLVAVSITMLCWTWRHYPQVYLISQRKNCIHIGTFNQNWAIWLSFFLFVSLFAFLLFTHNFQEKRGAWYSGGSSWGDIALHATYANYLARQARLSPVDPSPIFAQQRITYPFLFDWYASLLIRLGSGLGAALFISQLQATIALIALMLSSVRRLDRRVTTALWTLLLFFLGGGLGWWYFWGDWRTSGLTLGAFLNSLPWQFTYMPDRSIFFSNVMTDMLLPQRGFVIGLGAIISVIVLLFTSIKHREQRLMVLAAMIVGLLPLFHTHAFLWITGFWLVFGGWQYWHARTQRRSIVLATAVLIALAAPQLVWLRHNGISQQFLHWQLGWMLTEGQMFAQGWLSSVAALSRIWLLNFGLLTVWLIYLPTQMPKLIKQQPALALLFGYSWLVFVICFIVAFQPWAYDNLKLMMPSFFFLLVFAAMNLSTWWQGRGPLGKCLVGAVLVLSVGSGSLSVLRELQQSNELAPAREVVMAAQLRDVLQPGAITLAAPDHNHPVTMLVGQPVVLGYGGWLWTHGVDATQTAQDVAQIYAGGSEAERLLQKYHIHYVYISDRERSKYRIDEQYWSNRYPSIYRDDDTVVYDLGR